ncbi:MAG: signal peptidase II [Treponemataceae bacterium]|nr:MAG: signal peptidase II [Treponemataceae bacterium]
MKERNNKPAFFSQIPVLLIDSVIERKKYIVFTLVMLALNYGADKITKILAAKYLPGKGSVYVLRDFFILQYTENSGAFLSLGEDWFTAIKYIVLAIIPIAACIFGIVYIMFFEKRLAKTVTLACIIGGGLGNLIDRLMNDFLVVDFMNFGIGSVRSGILNVADLSVTFGIIVFLFLELTEKRI